MAALPAGATGWQLYWNPDWSRRPLHFGGMVAGWKVDLSHVGCRQRRLPHLASAISKGTAQSITSGPTEEYCIAMARRTASRCSTRSAGHKERYGCKTK